MGVHRKCCNLITKMSWHVCTLFHFHISVQNFFLNFVSKNVYEKKGLWGSRVGSKPHGTYLAHRLSSLEDRLHRTLSFGPCTQGPVARWCVFRQVITQQDRSIATKRQTRRGRPWDRQPAAPHFPQQMLKSIGLEETYFRSCILAYP